jgi:hypothetical protein
MGKLGQQKTYYVDEQERGNWLALFDEIVTNGDVGAAALYAWYLDSKDIIEQSIVELDTLDGEY